jgi:CspA family cold shock protein
MYGQCFLWMRAGKARCVGHLRRLGFSSIQKSSNQAAVWELSCIVMGRGRDFRGGGSGRGWHAHEEDHAALDQPPAYTPHSPSRRPQTDQGPTVEAIVKWFNPEKGFGFVEIADGSGDAFLSAKTLQMLGRDTLSPGAKLRVFVGAGDKGRQVTKIAAIEDGGQSTAPTQAATSLTSRPRHVEADSAAAKEVLGKVKWFSLEKGMGFVGAEDGGTDVFVHLSVVRKAGLANLSEGQRISMWVTETPKGRQAVSIATLG